MKMLTVSALVCAMMVLTRAAESRPVKTWTGGILGWYSFNGRCYRYIPTRMSWARAERNCQSLGGNLASVHNIEEYQAIQDVIFRATNLKKPTWIGGSDAVEERFWYWSDGTSFNYRRWCDGEPNNQGGRQHCLQMNYSAKKCWDDLRCTRQLPSVCVRERC
ncbi:ladderlectin-like [Epinephelus fuscoguttatus]|uniref:ladderlectin-like n=1 Tax=Epinephelus fuscoguttatus TaxID=293821 RepID=UPI0020D08116|nr:ladderlectin-like [Epinephelus fuscoguttatus]